MSLLRHSALVLTFLGLTIISRVDWRWEVEQPQHTSGAQVVVLPPPLPQGSRGTKSDGFLRKVPQPHTNDLGLWALFLDGRVEGPMTFRVTAYNEEDGHTPGTITASGLPVMAEITAACGPELELGAVIVLENGMIVRCLDRGGGIGEGELDIYLADLTEAERFGVQEIEGVIVR